MSRRILTSPSSRGRRGIIVFIIIHSPETNSGTINLEILDQPHLRGLYTLSVLTNMKRAITGKASIAMNAHTLCLVRVICSPVSSLSLDSALTCSPRSVLPKVSTWHHGKVLLFLPTLYYTYLSRRLNHHQMGL